ncbi:hypothetical protein GCM10028857_15580 [Salinarchaeum chitinilyticum]
MRASRETAAILEMDPESYAVNLGVPHEDSLESPGQLRSRGSLRASLAHVRSLAAVLTSPGFA